MVTKATDTYAVFYYGASCSSVREKNTPAAKVQTIDDILYVKLADNHPSLHHLASTREPFSVYPTPPLPTRDVPNIDAFTRTLQFN